MKVKHMNLEPGTVAVCAGVVGRWEVWQGEGDEQYVDFICLRESAFCNFDLPPDFTVADIGCTGTLDTNEICWDCPLRHGIPDPEYWGWEVLTHEEAVRSFWEPTDEETVGEWADFIDSVYRETENRVRYDACYRVVAHRVTEEFDLDNLVDRTPSREYRITFVRDLFDRDWVFVERTY